MELIDVTDVEIGLPALPALVNDEKVIIGTGLLEYLQDECPDCQK